MRLSLATAAVALLVACGSTAQVLPSAHGPGAGLGGPVAPSGVADGGSILTGAAGIPSDSGVAGGAGAPGRPSSDLRGGGVANGEALPGQSSDGVVPAGASAGGSVKMGFLVVDNNKITRQFGGAEGPDPMRKFDDIVKHLNEHGGLEGRRILAERFVIDGSQSDAPTWAQRACSFFAEDKRVAVVLSVEWTHPVLEGCLSAARIPHFDAGIAYNLDGLAQQEYLYSNITTIGRDRYEAVRLRAAADRGWVKRGDKVGVLIADCDPYNRVYDKIVAPAAASLGVQLLPQRSKCNEGIGDLGSGIAAGRSAVLRFRTEGVTTVMAVSPAESAIWTFFAQEAENQNFRPFYLVTSDALPHMLATHSGSFAMPETHREKLRGFGWKAIVDTGPTSAPATPVQRDARSACMRMSTDAGGAISANGVDASQLSWYFDVCDSVLFLGKLLAATGGDTRMQALVAAYDAVATAFDPANAPAGRFDPPAGRRDGIASVTSFAYDRRCRCMKYAGMPIAVP